MISATERDTLLDMMPFARTAGVELHSADADETVGAMDWAAERCTAGGVLHGGAAMTLADSVGAICAFLNLPEGTTTSTIESKTNFFRAVTSGRVRATARPLHVGGSTICVQTELLDDEGRLVAHVVQTQAVRRPGREPREDEAQAR